MAAITVGNGSGIGSRNRTTNRKIFDANMDDINFPTQRKKAEELKRKLEAEKLEEKKR